MKTMESIHIDLSKKIFLLNGRPMEDVSELHLDFEKGEWSLQVTETATYNLKRGGVMEMKIVNHIKINGQEYLFEELSAERKKDIACLIQENAMKAAGYCKVTRKEAAG